MENVESLSDQNETFMKQQMWLFSLSESGPPIGGRVRITGMEGWRWWGCGGRRGVLDVEATAADSEAPPPFGHTPVKSTHKVLHLVEERHKSARCVGQRSHHLSERR